MLAGPDEKVIQAGIEKVNLLDKNGDQLPESIVTAIEEGRIQDVLAYMKAGRNFVRRRTDNSSSLLWSQ